MSTKLNSTAKPFTFNCLLLPFILITIFCISVQSLTLIPLKEGLTRLEEQKEISEKRAIPIRNPYSWMAVLDEKQPMEKRSALRRPQNPYSWMAGGGEPSSEWTIEGLRPFSAAAKRLAVARAGISRNPYSWTNY